MPEEPKTIAELMMAAGPSRADVIREEIQHIRKRLDFIESLLPPPVQL